MMPPRFSAILFQGVPLEFVLNSLITFAFQWNSFIHFNPFQMDEIHWCDDLSHICAFFSICPYLRYFRRFLLAKWLFTSRILEIQSRLYEIIHFPLSLYSLLLPEEKHSVEKLKHKPFNVFVVILILSVNHFFITPNVKLCIE